MKRTTGKRGIAASIVVAGALGATSLWANEEGGYVYNQGEDRFVSNVYNFLQHFNYDQYVWCQDYQFTTHNQYWVDAMDIAYYSGHGSYWRIGMGPGSGDGTISTDQSLCDWGNQDLEFIVFQSCAVIPSILEKPVDWWTGWVPNTNFQGLHQALGYRTISYSGNGISDNFGARVADGAPVWLAWFAAINDERKWWMGNQYPGFGSVVMYPGLEMDTYTNYGADPPAGHGALRNYYQY